MISPLFLVTGATGGTGAPVVQQLLARGQRVRALVRRPDARAERLRALGAEIVVADLFDADQVGLALRGTQRAYFCPPYHPHMLQAAATFAVAAREARVESIVGLSQWLASPAHPALLTRQSWLMDELFAALPGIAHTILRPGLFADVYLRTLPYAAHLGLWPMPMRAEGRNAPPSNEDIARVAVAVLLDPARHEGRAYRPTGPDLLSVRDMTAVIGRVLARRVRRVAIPLPLLLKAARMDGFDAAQLAGFRHYIRDHDLGAFEIAAPTDDVRAVTGQPAEPFEVTVRRYASAPNCRRGLRASLATFAKFMRLPMAPGFNLKRMERDQRVPMPASPRYATEDAAWRRDRTAAREADERAPRATPIAA